MNERQEFHVQRIQGSGYDVCMRTKLQLRLADVGLNYELSHTGSDMQLFEDYLWFTEEVLQSDSISGFGGNYPLSHAKRLRTAARTANGVLLKHLHDKINRVLTTKREDFVSDAAYESALSSIDWEIPANKIWEA